MSFSVSTCRTRVNLSAGFQFNDTMSLLFQKTKYITEVSKSKGRKNTDLNSAHLNKNILSAWYVPATTLRAEYMEMNEI